ncbi:hypothetical protein EVAR_92176_1 [Eumeta japonica]|uniref:Uncharacterized protein n=1 Tax=Eumeta variegata TaxID=151549 RepID=A0A4C2AAV5_EUMVA|nr:hypothetical protein EVAR_92176_1 [Eumeta japonica]
MLACIASLELVSFLTIPISMALWSTVARRRAGWQPNPAAGSRPARAAASLTPTPNAARPSYGKWRVNDVPTRHACALYVDVKLNSESYVYRYDPRNGSALSTAVVGEHSERFFSGERVIYHAKISD